jgi:hypothetical protein
MTDFSFKFKNRKTVYIFPHLTWADRTILEALLEMVESFQLFTKELA